MRRTILTINGGSSSIKLAAFASESALVPLWRGKAERLGKPEAVLSIKDADGKILWKHAIAKGDASEALGALFDWQKEEFAAVGHRIVHGMKRTAPERVTPEVMAALRNIAPYDPEHLPGELALIEAVSRLRPSLPQVVCFDTAFHRDLPRVARMLPLPRRYWEQGVERYGFHGLSYTYLLQELERLGGSSARSGRVILAHLGSGASLAAVRDGRSIDTTMSFTPTAGVMMGTRTGDLDPGLVSYFAHTEQRDADAFHKLVTLESGLLGVSGITSDTRELLECEAKEPAAAEALELFCYSIRKSIGALTAALGGLDTLVFSGGIGENSAGLRSRICAGLEYLGLRLDAHANDRHAGVIGAAEGRVTVRVIPTNEELILAQMTARLLGFDPSHPPP